MKASRKSSRGGMVVLCKWTFLSLLGIELIGALGGTWLICSNHQMAEAEAKQEVIDQAKQQACGAVPEELHALAEQVKAEKAEAHKRKTVGEAMVVSSKWAAVALLVGARLFRKHKPQRVNQPATPTDTTPES